MPSRSTARPRGTQQNTQQQQQQPVVDWSQMQYPQWTAPDYSNLGAGSPTQIAAPNPGIWDQTQRSLGSMMQTGQPVNTLPAWYAAVQQGQDLLNNKMNELWQGQSMQHARFSSGGYGQFAHAGAEAMNALAAQRMQMELQAQENAKSRMIQSMGLGTELGNAIAQAQLGAENINLGYGNLSLNAAAQQALNAQNEIQNQMQLANMLGQFGMQMYGLEQQGLDRFYNEYAQTYRNYPFLDAAIGYATQNPFQNQQTSGWGDVLAGGGSMATGLAALWPFLA